MAETVLVIVVGAWALVLIFVVALCRMAARSDRMEHRKGPGRG